MAGKNSGFWRRLLAVTAACVLLASGAVVPSAAAETEDKPAADDSWKTLLTGKYEEDDYREYLAAHADVPSAGAGAVLKSDALLPESGGVTVKPFDGQPAIHIGEAGKAVLTLTVAETDMYALRLTYAYTALDTYRNSDLAVYVDGALPFRQAETLSLPRVWTQEEIVHVAGANDRKPDAEQLSEVATYIPADDTGKAGDYRFYLTAGTHSLTLSSPEGGFCLLAVEVGVTFDKPEEKNYPFTGDVIELEAEELYRKNDSSISAGIDRTDALTSPSDPVYKKVNCLSGSRFLRLGQSVSWKVSVKQNGRYRLALRYKQDSLPGLFACRQISIDGVPLYTEEDLARFPYSDKWGYLTVGDADGNALLLDLDAGEHVITMEVALGVLRDYVQRMDDAAFAMNYLYRQIVMVTGASPDPYRDYDLEAEIPILIPYFNGIRKELDDIADGLRELGAAGGLISVLSQAADQLADFVADSYRMQDRLSQYSGNIASISSLVLQLQETAVSIDKLYLISDPQADGDWQAGFFRSMWYQLRSFFGSFFCDYSAVGQGTDADPQKAVTVWYSGSNENSEILQNLVNEQFSRQHPDIPVNLKLVTLSLTQAILAGKAPDVILTAAQDQPVNLGARGVLEDLSAYPGYADVVSALGESLMVPYTYKDQVFGLPITLTYSVMFYRKDILRELDIRVPETWDDLYELLPLLQHNNLRVGLPSAVTTFYTLLLQRGASLYTDDLTAIRLDDSLIGEAFREYTEFFTKYELDLEFSLYDRFRTGEMPLAIGDYTTYNSLAAAAPEIRGLWDIAPIPGTKKADGSIDRSQNGTGTAVIMLKDSRHKENAWTFMKWWASADTQAAYGNALESVLGKASRYAPADMEALKQLPWSDGEVKTLQRSREDLTLIPVVLGDYYVTRGLNNGFRNTVYNGLNYKESLLTQNGIINTEMRRKQKEFGVNKE